MASVGQTTVKGEDEGVGVVSKEDSWVIDDEEKGGMEKDTAGMCDEEGGVAEEDSWVRDVEEKGIEEDSWVIENE